MSAHDPRPANDTTPYWEQIRRPKFGPLKQQGKFDVVVVGGGINGLSAALFLKQAGKTVCLLERGAIGSGDTGCTTAHLTYVTDDRLSELVKNFGREQAALVWYAGATAIDLIEQTVREHAIDCQFQRVPGFLHASLEKEEDETDALKADADLAEELGFAADFVPKAPIVGKPGVRFRDQAKFHPLLYLAALAQLVDGHGSAVHEKSEVTDIQSDPPTVEANGVTLQCDYVVVATHAPLMGKTGLVKATLMQSRLYPFSSYVIGASVPRGTLPEVSLWDTSDPYYYLRVDLRQDDDYVIFGGNDHKTGQETDTGDCYRRLEKTLAAVCPSAKVDYHWSGQVVETNDGLPLIGETAESQFVATGFAGNGITFGTLAGMMARDAVLKRENPWQDLFSVDRAKFRGGTWEYLKENVDYPFYMIADWLKGPKAESTRSIKRGEGKVLKLDGERVACSRDAKGKLHQVSAVCTHMGCLVRWNQAETTWDCPCHGSRFRATGEVVAGPAETPLPPIAKKKASTAPRKSAAKA